MRKVGNPEVKRYLPRERGEKFETFEVIIVPHLERARECRVVPFSSLRNALQHLGGKAKAEVVSAETSFLVEARAQDVVGEYEIGAREARGVMDGCPVPIDEKLDRRV